MEVQVSFCPFNVKGHYFIALNIECELFASFSVYSSCEDFLAAYSEEINRLNKYATCLYLIDAGNMAEEKLHKSFYGYFEAEGLFSNVKDRRVFKRYY